MLPARLRSQVTEAAELTAWAEAKVLQGSWDDLTLEAVEWVWDTLEGLETVESGLTALSLVWDHTTDHAPKDL